LTMGALTWVGLGLATLGGLLYIVRLRKSRSWGLCRLPNSVRGSLIIVTGGNAGLGKELCLELASRGARLVLACRSWENTKQALELMRTKSGNNDVHYMHLDLASLKSVREFAAEFLEKYGEGSLDTLVCNAGVWVPMDEGMKTEDGFEVHAGVNHLGHFLLANLLLPGLNKETGRVVMVSSLLANQAKLDLEAIDHFREGRQPIPGGKAVAPTGYCDSKLMNGLFASELGRREPWLRAVAVCPGWCYSQLARHVSFPLYKKILFAPIAFMFMRSGWRGAQNILQAVLEEKSSLVQGGFYRECKLASKETEKVKDMISESSKLWEVSGQLVGL